MPTVDFDMPQCRGARMQQSAWSRIECEGAPLFARSLFYGGTRIARIVAHAPYTDDWITEKQRSFFIEWDKGTCFERAGGTPFHSFNHAAMAAFERWRPLKD